MSEFLCVGDIVSLYCEETEGYVYNCQTRFYLAMTTMILICTSAADFIQGWMGIGYVICRSLQLNELGFRWEKLVSFRTKEITVFSTELYCVARSEYKIQVGPLRKPKTRNDGVPRTNLGLVLNFIFCRLVTYRVAKKRGHRLMVIILSILNRSKKLSLEDSWVNLQVNGYKKNPTAPCICCYTTL